MKIKHYISSFLIILVTFNSYAFSWQDLWKSKNQQAKEMMQKNDFSHAKNTFRDENWRAIAAFRDKDYQMAADLFAKSNAIDANYNLGNALANLGKYKDAIESYDKVLTINKNHQDAKYNKKILEKLLKKQQKQEKNNQKQNSKDQEKKNDSHQQKQKDDKKQKTNKEQQSLPKSSKNSPEKTKKNKKNKSLKQQKSQNKKDGKNQMQEQWLKLIPDDPGGLLREKFKRDYLRRQGELET